MNSDALQFIPASPLNRGVAKIIDFVVVGLIAAVLPSFLGPLGGFAYSLICDGIFWGDEIKGQSVGKKLLGLQTRSITRNEPIHFKESAIRNSPVGVVTFFAMIPIWGWIILILIGFPLLLIELYLMVRAESGNRIGDVMADTEVVLLENDGLFAKL